MKCPECSSTEINSDGTLFSIVTVNPTVPYANDIVEFICDSCHYHWFGTIRTIPVEYLPTILITSIVGGNYDPDLKELTIHVGESFTATGELQVGGAIYPLYSGVFRVPVVSLDGREKLILANVISGAATVSWTPSDSGIWKITAELMNRDIPPEQHVLFAGLKIFVLD